MYNILFESMEKKDIDWIILSGDRQKSTDIRYFLKDLTFASPIILIKKSEEPIIIHNILESEEALQSKAKTICRDEIVSRDEIRKLSSSKDQTKIFIKKCIEKFGISGKILLLGNQPFQRAFMIYEIMQKIDRIKLADIKDSDIIKKVREVKTDDEIEKIQDVSTKVSGIYREIRNLLKDGIIKNSLLFDKSGKPIKLGDIRHLVEKIIAEQGLSGSEIPIISMGEEAASPHMTGNVEMQVREGSPIVIDIFPNDNKTGYFSDMTRTFCVGKTSDYVKTLYNNVKEAYEIGKKSVKLGEKTSIPDIAVSDFFVQKGYKTTRDNAGTKEGYIHSLGHGVGLDVHESPRVSFVAKDIFQKMSVFTIEPGLYYKSKSAGIRLEDTFYIDHNGNLKNMTSFPMKLSVEEDI